MLWVGVSVDGHWQWQSQVVPRAVNLCLPLTDRARAGYNWLNSVRFAWALAQRYYRKSPHRSIRLPEDPHRRN